MKYFYSSLFFFLFTGVVLGQTAVIKGVIHLQDKTPIANATIRVAGTGVAGMSNEKGHYELKNVPYGKRTIVVTSVEIQEKKLPYTVNKPVHDFHIHLDPKGNVSIDEVAIEKKTVKKEIETSGFAVAVIETKEASLLNLTTNELLDRAVGVRVRQNGGEGSAIEYNLNGMSGSTIGLFLDGIEISTYGSSFNLNNIPPAMIERIEVYKGVLPAHLSGNYIGGAINVIMKKDASANNITAAVSYGSFNTYRGDISSMYRNQKNGFTARVSGFYSHSDNNYEMWGRFSKYTGPGGKLRSNYRTIRANDKFESVGGRFEFGFTDVKWADQFFLGYNISDSYKEIPHGITMTKPYFGRFNEYQAHVFSLNYNKRDLFIKGLALNVNAVHSRRNTYLQDTVSLKYNWDGSLLIKNSEGPPEYFGYEPGRGQQGEAVINDSDRKITNARTNLSYTILRNHRISLNHKLEMSGRDDRDLLRPERSQWITKNDLTTNIWALNYEASLFDGRLITNIFGKYAIYQTFQRTPQGGPNGSIIYTDDRSSRGNEGFGGTLSYQAVNNGFLIASAEKSFVMPTDRHIYGEIENNLLPNPGILPELSVNYNLGARYGLVKDNDHRLSLYANAFWRNGYDKIILQTRTEEVLEGRENQVEDIQATQFVNLSKTQSIGFEGEVNYIYKNRLNAVLNFSKFNSLFKLEQDERGNPHSLYNVQVPNEPFFTINGNVQYRFNNLFQKKSVLNVYYDAGYVAPFSTIWIVNDHFMTPAQLSHDFGVSYRFPSGKLVVSVDGKNLSNAEVYDNFGVQKPGRAFYIKLNYTINNFNR